MIGGLTTNASPLYNGNIAAMAVNIPKLSSTKLYNYKYDQLNRLVAMDLFNGLNPVAGSFTASISTEYRERVSYDPNGNILTYQRNGDAARLTMDNLTYSYKPNINQLHKVADAAADASAGAYPNYQDLRTGQADNNYVYDAIGNLVQDVKDTITNITWNVYGKIESITQNAKVIRYTYDAAGNRISKSTTTDTTFYVRDASCNVLSVYHKPAAGQINQEEVHLYCSSRLGMVTRHLAPDSSFSLVNSFGKIYSYKFTRGEKLFELSNHLGNVLVTIADRVQQVKVTSDTVRHYLADVRSANDYYPFGMLMPGRKFNAGSFRYGFNGKEMDNEVKGVGNQVAFEARVFDPRLGRFLSRDPREADYPWQSTYAYYRNSPIATVDFLGMGDYYSKDGKRLGSDGKTKMITVGKGKNAKTKEVADDKAYFATSVKLNDKGLVESAENSVELSVSNSVLNQLANTTAEESSGDMKESFAIASTIVNLSNYKGESISQALQTEGIYGYGNGGNSTKYKNNAEFGMQAALNAVLGGYDYSNGAIRWDGFDLAIKGWGHIKSTSQGLGISKTHLETFKNYWSAGNNLTSTSGNPNAVYNSTFIMNGNASLTYSAANKEIWKGMVLYTSSAAYGGTIFWKATPVFTIHGINLNSNYEKIKGRTNKPL